MNGNVLCAMAVATTGPDPWYDELVEICMVTLDTKYKVFGTPFHAMMLPDHPERIERKFSADRQTKWKNDRVDTIDALVEWIDRVGLKYCKYGSVRGKLIPVGHGLHDWWGHFIRWFGPEHAAAFFQSDPRDIKIAANYLNDRSAARSEKVPYSKRDLAWLSTQHSVATPTPPGPPIEPVDSETLVSGSAGFFVLSQRRSFLHRTKSSRLSSRASVAGCVRTKMISSFVSRIMVSSFHRMLGL